MHVCAINANKMLCVNKGRGTSSPIQSGRLNFARPKLGENIIVTDKTSVVYKLKT